MTKKQIQDTKNDIEKALATSLGVEAGNVNIIDIIEVQKRRRQLLESTAVQIIYEVKVKDDTEAKEVKSNMEAKEFKSNLSNNIQIESPNLTALTVANVEQPKVKQRKVNSTDKESDQDTASIKEKSPGDESSLWPILGITLLLIIVLGCCCMVGKMQYDKLKLRRATQLERSNNSWNMDNIEMQEPIFHGNPVGNAPQPKKSEKPTRSSVTKTKHDQQWQEFYDANRQKLLLHETTGTTQWKKPISSVSQPKKPARSSVVKTKDDQQCDFTMQIVAKTIITIKRLELLNGKTNWCSVSLSKSNRSPSFRAIYVLSFLDLIYLLIFRKTTTITPTFPQYLVCKYYHYAKVSAF